MNGPDEKLRHALERLRKSGVEFKGTVSPEQIKAPPGARPQTSGGGGAGRYRCLPVERGKPGPYRGR